MAKNTNSQTSISDKKLWRKLKKYSRSISKKTIYFVLLLFQVAKSSKVPKSSKMIVVGALSYLLLPIDMIPDFIPAVGLADDASVIAAAVYKIMIHIDDEMKGQAKKQIVRLFGEDVETTALDKHLPIHY